MSKVQLTKNQAIMKIDEVLESEFIMCVGDTYNELIETVNQNAKAGTKKKRGTVVVGYNPFNVDYEDIRFDIDKDSVIDLWLATLGGRRARLKQIEKFTSKFDLFCWDYDNYHTFGFKLFTGGLFGGMTKTGKRFVQELNALLSGTGMRLSFQWCGLVSVCKINYTCVIPNGYQPKKKLGQTNSMSVESVQATVKKYLDKIDWDGSYNEIESGAMFDIMLESKNLPKEVRWGGLVNAQNSTIMIALDLGRAPSDKQDVINALIDSCNSKISANGFEAEIVETDDGFDPMVSVSAFVKFENEEDLTNKVFELMNEAINIVQRGDLFELANETSEF